MYMKYISLHVYSYLQHVVKWNHIVMHNNTHHTKNIIY